MNEVAGLRDGTIYLRVDISPPLRSRFWDGPWTDFDQLILALVGNRTLHDLGKLAVMTDIILCPEYAGGTLDETRCSRIGTGSLHLTYADALSDSPVERTDD